MHEDQNLICTRIIEAIGELLAISGSVTQERRRICIWRRSQGGESEDVFLLPGPTWRRCDHCQSHADDKRYRSKTNCYPKKNTQRGLPYRVIKVLLWKVANEPTTLYRPIWDSLSQGARSND